MFRSRKHISNLCKGLPLAVSLIGPVLNRSGSVLDLWVKVAVNLNSYLGGEGCRDIVELSYKYLPDHLKPCFLYLGGFSRSQDIWAGNMKRLWIAEGFVMGNQMQLANEYLEDLVSQNVVVVTERSSRGGIKRCRVHHDLLYDLCLEKNFQDEFICFSPKISDTEGNCFQYRLFATSPLPLLYSTIGGLPCRRIPTLLIHHSEPLKLYPDSCRNLRVLNVIDCRYLITDMLPEVIWLNIHVRHLALGPRIREIPPSIVELRNLETLTVNAPSSSVDVQIPATIWEMESLKYVEINYFCLNLKDLRHKNMAAAGPIEVLKGVILEFDIEADEFLRRLVRLQKLRCCLPRKKLVHPMWFPVFGSLENLDSLHLYCSHDGYELRLPPSANLPNHLKNMCLEGFELPWSALSAIGKLPNLEVFKLERIACWGAIWHLEDGEFSKLRFLKLHDIIDVERICDSGCDETPFPCLEKLILHH